MNDAAILLYNRVMEIINYKDSIYVIYNNIFQLSLPLETTVLLEKNDHLSSLFDAKEGEYLNRIL